MYIRKTREYTYEKITLKTYTQWSVVAFGYTWLSTKTSKVDTDTTHKNLCSNYGHLSNLGCYNNRDKKWHHTYRAFVPPSFECDDVVNVINTWCCFFLYNNIPLYKQQVKGKLNIQHNISKENKITASNTWTTPHPHPHPHIQSQRLC